MDALLAGLEQLAPGLGQGRASPHVSCELEDVLAFKVAAWGDAIGSHEFVSVAAQNLTNLVRCVQTKNLPSSPSLSASCVE
jgi:hypothetical protein